MRNNCKSHVLHQGLGDSVSWMFRSTTSWLRGKMEISPTTRARQLAATFHTHAKWASAWLAANRRRRLHAGNSNSIHPNFFIRAHPPAEDRFLASPTSSYPLHPDPTTTPPVSTAVTRRHLIQDSDKGHAAKMPVLR